MFIRIEKGSSVPISRQIASQFRAQCLAGTLPPGSKVPSVRELAVTLAVNPNTILRVYEKLTAEGYLQRRHGSGTFIADKLPMSQMAPQQDQFEEELEQVVRHGRMLGLDEAALRTLFEQTLDKTQSMPGGDEEDDHAQ
jgi:GntR family transcriptional regulator